MQGRRKAAVNAETAIAVSSASIDVNSPQFLYEHPHLPLPPSKLIFVFDLHTAPCSNAHSAKDCHSPNCPHIHLTKGVFAKRATPTAALGRDPNDIQRTSDGHTGLRNLGATCYLNTLFQSLFMNTHFAAAFPLYTAATTAPSTATTSARVSPLPVHPADKIDLAVNDILQLFAMMKFGGRRYISPFAVVKALDIQSHIQQDVHEFNALILSMFESAFNAFDQRQTLSNKHTPPLKLGQLLAHLFKGEKRDVRQCCICKRETFTSSDFYDLQLAITALNENTVNAALQQYTHTELLNGGNQVTCADCGCKRDMTRSEQIHRLPPYLTLHLQRFCYDINSNSKKKVHESIFVPDTLAMDGFVAQQCIDKEVRRRQNERITSPTPHNTHSSLSLLPSPLPIRPSSPSTFASQHIPSPSFTSTSIASPLRHSSHTNGHRQPSTPSQSSHPSAAPPSTPLLVSSLTPLKSSHSPPFLSSAAESFVLEPVAISLPSSFDVKVAQINTDEKMSDINDATRVDGAVHDDNATNVFNNGVSSSSFRPPITDRSGGFIQTLHSPTPLPSSPLREVGVLPVDQVHISPTADTDDTDMTRSSDDDALVEVLNVPNSAQARSPVVAIEITDDPTESVDANENIKSTHAARRCLNCNTELPSAAPNRKYCDAKCRNLVRRKTASASTRNPRSSKTVDTHKATALAQLNADSTSVTMHNVNADDKSSLVSCEVCQNGIRVGESICSNVDCLVNSQSHDVRRSTRFPTSSPAPTATLTAQVQSTMDEFVTTASSPLSTKSAGKRRILSASRSVMTPIPLVSGDVSTPDVAASAVFAYDLTAVLMHKGTSANSGHYIAFIRDESNVWWKFDDENVTPVGAHWYDGVAEKSANTAATAKKAARGKKSKGDESDEYEPPKDSDSGDEESGAHDDDSVQLMDDTTSAESTTTRSRRSTVKVPSPSSRIRSKRRRKALTVSKTKKQRTSNNAAVSPTKDDSADVLVTSSASSFVNKYGSGGTSKEAYMLIYAARNRNERLQQWPSSDALWDAAEHLKAYVSNQQKQLEDAKTIYAEYKGRLDAIAAKRRKAATAVMSDLQCLEPLTEATPEDDLKLCRFVPFQWLSNLLNGVNEREKRDKGLGVPGRPRKAADSDVAMDDVPLDDASPEINLLDDESKADVIDLRESSDPKQNGINLTGSDDENDETSMPSDNAASGNGTTDGNSGGSDDPTLVDAVRADMSEESIRAGFARALEQLVPHKLSAAIEQLQCSHNKIDPKYCKKIKRVTIDAWSRIIDLYLDARATAPASTTDPLISSSPPLEDESVLRGGVTIDHFCEVCARAAYILSAKRIQQVKQQATLIEKITKTMNESKEEDTVKEQIVLESDENNPHADNRTVARERDSDRLLLSRDWFNRFKAKSVSQRKNLDKDKKRTYAQQIEYAKRQSIAQQAETTDVNAALICKHGNRAIKVPVITIIRKHWNELIKLVDHGKHTVIDESTPLCPQCEEEETALLTSFNSVKDERDAVGRWSGGVNRPFPDAKKPPHSDKKGFPWYILTNEFRERVYQYTQGQSGLIKPVFDIETLLCPHDRFKYSPYPYSADENNHLGGTAVGHLVLVHRTDFEHLKKFGFIDSDGKFEGVVTLSAHNHALAQLPGDYSWDYIDFTCQPPVCEECVRERRRIEESAAFEDGTLTAILKTADATNTTNTTTSRGRQLRAKRHQSATINGVHSAMTIETLKMKIFERLGVEPARQQLTYKTQKLELADMSIAQYSVPNRAEIIVEPVDDDDDAPWNVDAPSSRRQKKETGFSGTAFYSLQSIQPTSNGHAANGNGIIHIESEHDDMTITADDEDDGDDDMDVRHGDVVTSSPVYDY